MLQSGFSMYFELTPEVIDQIIFAMEDQQASSQVLVETGEVVNAAQLSERPDVEAVPVPDWKPVDGYHLMERFVAGLRNPVYQDALRDSLASGKGVFRSFKNTLKNSKEIEKLWYHFKEHEMRQIVREWYDTGREARGLERLGPEPEETDELVSMDFVFVDGAGREGPVEGLDRLAFAENIRQVYPEAGDDDVDAAYDVSRRFEPELDAPESRLICAASPSDELVGFVWGIVEEPPVRGREWRIVQLAVTPSYRGLGVATHLLDEFTRRAADNGARSLTITLTGDSLKVSSLFDRAGFIERTRVLERDLDEWVRNG